MNVTDSVSKLTCLINGISMAGPHETVPLESCEHIARAIHTSGWLKQVQSEAWGKCRSTHAEDCAWCPQPSSGTALHNDGMMWPSCGQAGHGRDYQDRTHE